MTKLKQPYIGVAATMSGAEALMLADFVDGLDWPTGVRFMNGPLVSHRTMQGEAASRPERYPSLGDLAGILIDHPCSYNVVHYNGPNPRLYLLLENLQESFHSLHGVQLNMKWPQAYSISTYRNWGGNLDLILQVGEGAYGVAGSSPTGLIERLKPYEGLIDYVLFDPSGGLGLPFDQEEATRVLEALVDSGLQIRWGVTGGLNGYSVSRLDPLLKVYPELSWDAESGLRDSSDSLDLNACKTFLIASAEARRGRRV